MRSLLVIIGILLVMCAADVFGMGKSDGSKTKVAAEAAKPVKVKPVKVEPVKIEPTKPAEKPDANKVVLTINGVTVKSGEVESRVDNTMKMRMGGGRSRMPANRPPDALKNMRERIRQGVIEGLIIENLIDQKVKERKIQVTDKEVDDELQNVMTSNKMTMEQLKEQISAVGLTLELLKKQFKRRAGLGKLLALEMKAANEPLQPTDAEAKTFYDANQRRFGESVRASHILIKADMKNETAKAEAMKKIEDLLKRARGGEDFAELATQYTDDGGSKKTRGEYTFPRGEMTPPFEQAAFSLEVGQISDVVETQYGYHIIKLSEKIPAKNLDDVKADIAKELGERKKNTYWRTKFMPRLKSEAKIEWAPGEKERIDKASRPPAIRPAPKRPAPKPAPK